MRRNRILAFAFIASVSLLGVGACASSGAGKPESGDATTVRHSGNVITQEEIETSGTANALEAVKRLRANFLVVRGAMSRSKSDIGVVVYANGAKLGSTSTLSSISTQEIRQIEYISASDATQRFGTGHSHGAILVTRK
jgi:hypothetical protein